MADSTTLPVATITLKKKAPAGSFGDGGGASLADEQIDDIFAEMEAIEQQTEGTQEEEITAPAPMGAAPLPVAPADQPVPELDTPGGPQPLSEVPQSPDTSDAGVIDDLPDEQIDSIFEEMEIEQSRDEQIQSIADESFEGIERARNIDKIRGYYSFWIDTFDLPGRVAATTLDLLTAGPNGIFEQTEHLGSGGFDVGEKINTFLNGLGKLIGLQEEGEEFTPEETGLDKGVPAGGFRMIAESLGLLQTEEEREPIFGNRGTLEPSLEYEEGRFVALNFLITALSSLLRGLKVPEHGIVAGNPFSPYSKTQVLNWVDGVRNFLASIGQVAVDAPANTAALETYTGALAVQGDRIARRDFPDSAAARFVFPVVGASVGSLLTIRTAYSFLAQGKNAYSAKFGKASVENNAAAIVQRYKTGTNKNAIDNLMNPEMFHPSIMKRLNIAEKTMDEGIIGMNAVFYTAEDASRYSAIKRWQELKAMIVELSSVPRGTVNITEKSIKESIEGQFFIMAERQNIIRERLKAEVLKKGPGMTEAEANVFAYKLLFDENDTILTTNRMMWSLVDQDLPLVLAPAHKAMENVLRKIIREEGTPEGILELTKIGKGTADDLFKFIGRMKFIKPVAPKKGVNEALGGKQEQFLPKGKWVFEPGEWGKGTVDLAKLQAIRSRVLQTIRAEQGADVPRLRRIQLLFDIEEGLIHSLGSAEMLKVGAADSIEKQLYLEGLAHTRQMKNDWGKGEAYNILNIGPRGKAPSEKLALSKITSGAGRRMGAAQGAEVIEDLFSTLRPKKTDSPSDALRRAQSLEQMIGAMEDVLKSQMEAAAVTGGKYNVKAAEDWLVSNRRVLDLEELAFIKTDIEASVKAENALALKERVVTAFTTRMKNSTDISIAGVYAGKNPSAAWEEIISKADDKVIDRLTRDIILRVEKAPNGKGREGLESSFYLWLLESGFHKKINSLEGPEVLSGLAMRDKWDLPATQRIARILLDKGRMAHIEKSIHGLTVLEHAQKNAAISETLDIKPNNMVVNLLRWAALRFSPVSKGPGSLMISKHLSTNVTDHLTKRHKDPIVDYLMAAFNGQDEKLLFALLADINKKGNAPIVAKQINAFAVAAGYETGELSINGGEISSVFDSKAPQEQQ
jgi:hypothetical protein